MYVQVTARNGCDVDILFSVHPNYHSDFCGALQPRLCHILGTQYKVVRIRAHTHSAANKFYHDKCYSSDFNGQTCFI